MSTVFINKMVGTEAQASVSTSCPWDYHIQTWVKCTSRIFNICILQFSSLREFEIKIHVNCLYKQNGWNRGASLCFNKLPLRLSHPHIGHIKVKSIAYSKYQSTEHLPILLQGNLNKIHVNWSEHHKKPWVQTNASQWCKGTRICANKLPLWLSHLYPSWEMKNH